VRLFDSPDEASRFLAPQLDRPVDATRLRLAPGIVLRTEPLQVSAGFTNAYTVSWQPPASAEVFVTEPPVSARAFAERGDHVVTATAGFFFLADRCQYRPRTLSLNLAIHDGRILSLPTADQEALVSRAGALSVVQVPAQGELTLGGRHLRWAGTRTGVAADVYAYGNANCVILHRSDELTGKVRVFQEQSRFTPPIADGSWSDLGFKSSSDGSFEAVARNDQGRLDIFRHDLVLRCPRTVAREGIRAQVHTVGPLTPQKSLQAAISVGPALSCPDLHTHPLNDDRSLGSFPLLRERAAARLVFYETSDGCQHLTLFDARPGSPTFTGVTLAETVPLIRARGEVVAGCLLDSGHTSRINAWRDGTLTSFGNRHYLRWPTPEQPRFAWNPDEGRPAASVIALR